MRRTEGELRPRSVAKIFNQGKAAGNGQQENLFDDAGAALDAVVNLVCLDFLSGDDRADVFQKIDPHFSHEPPLRCSCLQAGHSYRSVAWQRGQNRAISRASAPHLKHLIMRCAGALAFAEDSIRARGTLLALVLAGASLGLPGVKLPLMHVF